MPPESLQGAQPPSTWEQVARDTRGNLQGKRTVPCSIWRWNPQGRRDLGQK